MAEESHGRVGEEEWMSIPGPFCGWPLWQQQAQEAGISALMRKFENVNQGDSSENRDGSRNGEDATENISYKAMGSVGLSGIFYLISVDPKGSLGKPQRMT